MPANTWWTVAVGAALLLAVYYSYYSTRLDTYGDETVAVYVVHEKQSGIQGLEWIRDAAASARNPDLSVTFLHKGRDRAKLPPQLEDLAATYAQVPTSIFVVYRGTVYRYDDILLADNLAAFFRGFKKP